MADKKISELPLITTISGSIVYVPIVHDGITEKITVENFSNFTNKYAAQTGSANIFTANQTINANLSVSGTSTVSGNASVGGYLVVNGKLTAQELFTEITSASILFESGSTIFGNSGDDTHQFTGVVSINGISIGAAAINDFTASQLANDTRMLYITGALNSFTQSQIGKDGTLAEVTSSLRYFYETTSSLHAFTASQIGKDGTLGLVTSSLNLFTQSQIGKDGTLAEVTSSLRYFYQTTSSLHAFTASQIGKDGTLGLVTSSLNDFTQSQIGKDNTLALVTSSFNSFTQSQIGKDGTLGLVTSSFNAFTQSQIGKDFTLSIVTSSLNNYTSSVIGQANTIAVFTASINAFTASQIGKDGTLAIVTSSINAHILKQATQTGSQDLVNYQNSIITSSFRIELNSIEAYTSSLKSAITVNGSNVQIIGELNVNKLNVQYISSSVLLTSGSNIFGDAVTDKHEFTGSVNIKDTLFIDGQAIGLTQLNAFTGSQIGKDLTLSIVTSSIDAHILKQATQTGSQDLVNFNISVVTASIDSHILKQSTQTGSQDLVNYNISVVTASINQHILKQATQTGSQDIVNFNISVVTSSIDAHILKQSTQTGSQDLVNYNISVVTSSIDSHILKQATQTGSQDLVNLGISTFTGSLRSEVNLIEAYTASLKGAAIVSSSQQITNYFTFAKTGSANTFYGNQTISGGNLTANGLISTTDVRSNNGASDGQVVLSNMGGSYYGGGTYYAGDNGSSQSGFRTGMYYFGSTSNYVIERSTNTQSYGALPTSLTYTPAVSVALATGDVTVSTGNLIFSNGKGIDFSATSNSSGTMGSELLNDYEEGTWTPILADASTAGNTATGAFSGFYTKIGRLVILQATCGTITTTGMTGANTLYIRGLPFAIAGSTQLSAGAANFYNVVMGANGSIAWINAAAGTTYIRILKQASGTTNADLIVSNVTSTTGEISFTIQYYA